MYVESRSPRPRAEANPCDISTARAWAPRRSAAVPLQTQDNARVHSPSRRGPPGRRGVPPRARANCSVIAEWVTLVSLDQADAGDGVGHCHGIVPGMVHSREPVRTGSGGVVHREVHIVAAASAALPLGHARLRRGQVQRGLGRDGCRDRVPVQRPAASRGADVSRPAAWASLLSSRASAASVRLGCLASHPRARACHPSTVPSTPVPGPR